MKLLMSIKTISKKLMKNWLNFGYQWRLRWIW